ncbi:MAG: hypothetical protein H0W48_13925 [Methylibium sp.]|nr:hypothetical protein [Methylibium sp.]MBA3625516.1 hypothetical protein [Methylibium sp.]
MLLGIFGGQKSKPHIVPGAAQRRGFFARRWRGERPAAMLFWHDIVVVASLLNLLASFAALMLMAQRAPMGLPVALHFAPLPYNLFLCLALWRHAACSRTLAWAAGLWFLAAALL